jgi:hypothetical protein
VLVLTGHGWEGEFVSAHSGGAAARGEMTSPLPRLTFACELDPDRLAELFADPVVIDDLLALGARVALMCSDFSDERAGVLYFLGRDGRIRTGGLLLPKQAR